MADDQLKRDGQGERDANQSVLPAASEDLTEAAETASASTASAETTAPIETEASSPVAADAGDKETGEAAAAITSADTAVSEAATTPAANAAPKTYPARVVALEEEPYEYEKSTLLVMLHFLPEDGDEAGREVALSITTHSDIPIMKLTRLKELEPLPVWLQSLLDEMKEQMPQYAADAERKKEEEKAIKRAATQKVSSTSAKNLKSSAGGKKTGASSAPPPPDATNAPKFDDQVSLFDLATGHRPQNATEAATPTGGQ